MQLNAATGSEQLPGLGFQNKAGFVLCEITDVTFVESFEYSNGNMNCCARCTVER